MKVVYKVTMSEKIRSAKMLAELDGRLIERVELSTGEMDELIKEHSIYDLRIPYFKVFPRNIKFDDLSIVEVS